MIPYRLLGWLGLAGALFLAGASAGYRYRTPHLERLADQLQAARTERDQQAGALASLAAAADARGRQLADDAARARQAAAQRVRTVTEVVYAPASPSPACGPAADRLERYLRCVRDHTDADACRDRPAVPAAGAGAAATDARVP